MIIKKFILDIRFFIYLIKYYNYIIQIIHIVLYHKLLNIYKLIQRYSIYKHFKTVNKNNNELSLF